MGPANDILPALQRIVSRHGSAILGDRRRLVGLLRDHAPDRLAAIRLFVAAFDTGMPQRLKAGPHLSDEMARESEALAASSGCGLDLARQAVAAWAGILSSPRPMPLPGVPGIQPLPTPLSPMQAQPGSQTPSRVEPLPGPISAPGPLPLPVSAGVPSRLVSSRTVLWVLSAAAALILAFVLVRALAS